VTDAEILKLVQAALADYEIKADAITVMNWMVLRCRRGLEDDLEDLLAGGKIAVKR
jgi:hypothetical protein